MRHTRILKLVFRHLELQHPKNIPAEDLHKARRSLYELFGPLGLLYSRLSRSERYRLGPKATDDARWLTGQVATAMNAAPDAYPDVPFTPAAIKASFEATEAARLLWHTLAMFAQLAHDHYLIFLAESGDAARLAVRIVANARAATREMEAKRSDGMCLALKHHRERSARAWKSRRDRQGKTPTGRPRKAKQTD